jgi:hypothetical protein
VKLPKTQGFGQIFGVKAWLDVMNDVRNMNTKGSKKIAASAQARVWLATNVSRRLRRIGLGALRGVTERAD